MAMSKETDQRSGIQSKELSGMPGHLSKVCREPTPGKNSSKSQKKCLVISMLISQTRKKKSLKRHMKNALRELEPLESQRNKFNRRLKKSFKSNSKRNKSKWKRRILLMRSIESII